MSLTTTVNEPKAAPGHGEIDDGDHDRFAHYVNKTKLTRSAVTGEAVEALCGKKWVPTRAPERYQVCPACKRVYEGLKP